MMNRKKDVIHFLEWMRNGVAFCTTWFLILVLVYCYLSDVQTLLTTSLIKMLVWIIGGVFIFNLFFTHLIIRKWSFVSRLSGFMIAVSFYESVGFYWLGFFQGTGSAIQWSAFVGIVLVLCLICIAIYHRYSRRQGEIYSQALQRYQQKRSMENGK